MTKEDVLNNSTDVSLSLNLKCPFCSTEQRLTVLYFNDLPVTNYCNCGRVFKFRLKIDKKKKDGLLLKFEVVKTDIKGKKLKDGG